jgi:hypothetical protein
MHVIYGHLTAAVQQKIYKQLQLYNSDLEQRFDLPMAAQLNTYVPLLNEHTNASIKSLHAHKPVT